MTDIPEDIMREAESLAAELPMRVLTDPDSVATTIARALLAAEKRGAERAAKHEYEAGQKIAIGTEIEIREAVEAERERCARIAERDADWPRFGKTSVEAWENGPDDARDYRIGIVSGRAIAAAIRKEG